HRQADAQPSVTNVVDPLYRILLDDPTGGRVQLEDDPRIGGAGLVHREVGQPGGRVERRVENSSVTNPIDTEQTVVLDAVAVRRQVPLAASGEDRVRIDDAAGP